jgi:hypothetical protein
MSLKNKKFDDLKLKFCFFIERLKKNQCFFLFIFYWIYFILKKGSL